MRVLLLSLTVVGFLVMPVWVYADGCSQYTVMTGGKMLMCQQCCYHGQCQVSCL
jgi:hypothetical protein